MDAVVRTGRLSKITWPELGLFVGGILWATSLVQVVFYTTHGPVLGYWVFLTGWMAFALLQFAWYANLLLLLSILLMQRYPNRAMLLAVGAVLLAGQAFWFESIPGETALMQITELGSGFWCWYSGMILMSLGVIFGSGDRTTDIELEKEAPKEPSLD